MENQKDPLSNPLDELIAENNLLKIKLKLEHGMFMDNASALSPDLENQWLKSVYAFEQQFRDVKKVKVYDRIGRPVFKKWDTLSRAETAVELQGLRVLMENCGVELDCICEYDDTVIYKFLTEELFQHEMDDMNIPGMICHFIYEEFHPNHDHDLRRHSSELIEAIFTRPWHEEFDVTPLAKEISCSGKHYNNAQISAIITTFQEAHTDLVIEKFEISKVEIDTELTKGSVIAMLSISGNMRQSDKVRYEGTCTFHFIRDNDYWYIREFYLPGFSGMDE